MKANKPEKKIYFPTGIEPGMKRGTPCLIHVYYEFEDLRIKYIKATLDKNWQKGDRRGGTLLMLNRSIPYTPEDWQACQDHIKRREALESEYTKLVKSATRKNKRKRK